MKIEVACENCGKLFLKEPCYIRPHNFCCRECARPFLSQKMSELNRELNPTRMRQETKDKISKTHLAAGNNGRTYEKTQGRHTHRRVAESILGRPLKPGEVVHHKDGNRRNNAPDNLKVFSSQAEHAAEHKRKKVMPDEV